MSAGVGAGQFLFTVNTGSGEISRHQIAGDGAQAEDSPQRRSLRQAGQRRGRASLTSEATARRSSPPTLMADTIAKAITVRRLRTRYAVGYGARPIISMHDVLPDRAFDTFIRRPLLKGREHDPPGRCFALRSGAMPGPLYRPA